MKTRDYFFLLLLLVSLGACEEDPPIEPTPEIIEPSPEPEEGSVQVIDLTNYVPASEMVTADVLVKIVDEANLPIEKAVIKMLGSSYSTNKFGIFQLEGIELDKQGTLLTVEKDGYFQGSRRFFPIAENVAFVTVQLLEAKVIGSFNADQGGSASSSEGLSLSFPSNSIVNAVGNPYNGEVSIAAKWIDPSSEMGAVQMPGNLQGVNGELNEVALASFSMAAIELNGEGQKLNLASGSQAEIEFPISFELLDNAPEQIPLWYFDDQFGIWVEEVLPLKTATDMSVKSDTFRFGIATLLSNLLK